MRIQIILTVAAAMLLMASGQEPEAIPTGRPLAPRLPRVDEEGSGIVVPEVETATEFRDWLLTLTPEERTEVFKASRAGPMPKGVYTGFMLSDRPNYEDFDISILNKAVMSFVFDRWLGKVFDGEGGLLNILSDEAGFMPEDLEGTLKLKKGYVDKKKSWLALYGEDTSYGFILDEFREVRPGFLFGKTFLVPAKKGDKVFFECGLVRLEDTVPEGMTPREVILESLSEVEPEGEGESTPETVGWAEEEESYGEGPPAEPERAAKKPKATAEGEPLVLAQQSEVSMPKIEDEAPEGEAPEEEMVDDMIEAPLDEASSIDVDSMMDK